MTDKSNQIYDSLAVIYDDIMKNVDYEDWADFIDAVIQEHHPDAVSILELACGTGKVAMYLDELECYEITATDNSEKMLDIARPIAEFKKMRINWKQMDYKNPDYDETYDVVLNLFDSLNYVLDKDELAKTIDKVVPLLNEDGIFIFDVTTPLHSMEVEKSLNEEGITADDYRYERRSYYIPAERIHMNEFEIEKLDKDRVTVLSRTREVHRQRVYELSEIKEIIAKTGFEIVAAYDEFDFIDADENSNRITMVLKCRTTP